MSKPAARIGDMHVCPMVTPGTPPVPHVGGPITGPGVPTVLIGGKPAAVMGDMCTCTGPPDSIILGSTGVLIGGKPAARMGDMCAHGGSIVLGQPNVLIGEVAPGASPAVGAVVNNILQKIEGFDGGEAGALAARQILSLKKAATSGAAFCEICEKKAKKNDDDGGGGSGKKAKEEDDKKKTEPEVVKTIDEFYFANYEGDEISEVDDEKSVYLVVKGKNIAGEEVLVNFHDNPGEFTFNGKEIENDELTLELMSDEGYIELGVKLNNKKEDA